MIRAGQTKVTDFGNCLHQCLLFTVSARRLDRVLSRRADAVFSRSLRRDIVDVKIVEPRRAAETVMLIEQNARQAFGDVEPVALDKPADSDLRLSVERLLDGYEAVRLLA